MMGKFVDVSPPELERLKAQYVAGLQTLAEIAAQNGRSQGWLQHLARRQGWKGRTATAPVKRGRKLLVRTAADLRRMRAEVEAGILALDNISSRFKCGRQTLTDLIKIHGWDDPRPAPGSAKQRPTAVRGPKARSPAQVMLDRRAEIAAHDRDAYGDDIADIDWLRRRGYVCNREGPGVRVGNALCTFEQMREKAARERRLAKVMA